MEFRNSKQNFVMIASKFTMATWYTDPKLAVLFAKFYLVTFRIQHQQSFPWHVYSWRLFFESFPLKLQSSFLNTQTF